MLVKNAYELFLLLQEKGIQLRLDHEQNLKCQAPKGVMTEALLLLLKEYKAELIRMVKNHAISDLSAITGKDATHFSPQPEQIRAPESLLIDGRYPLSMAEKRFWFLHTLSETPHYYNVSVSYRVLGVLDIHALEQAVSAVINRHTILRTSFVMHQGEICRSLQPSTSFKVSVLSCSDQTEDQWMDTLIQRQKIDFDLFSSPLLRVDFLVNQQASKTTQDQCLLFCLHHLICDAWSVEILLKEIFSYYLEYTQGKKALLPDVSLQYIDYALWQDDQISQKKEALSFWCHQLQNVENLLEETDIFADSLASAGHLLDATPKKNIRLFFLAQNEHEKILAFSKKNQVSVFNFMLFCYGLFLYYSFEKQHFAVGVPVTTRNTKAAENMIGCLINTIAVKFSVDDSLTFTEFFAKMKASWSNLMPYQEVPFEKIVDAMGFGAKDQKNKYPIFQTLLAYHKNDSVDHLEWQGLSLSKVQSMVGIAKVPVQLTVTETTSQIQCEWEWDEAFFDDGQLLQWTQSFQALIRLVLDSESIQIKDCQLFKLQRKSAILVGIERRNFYQQVAPYVLKDWHLFEKNIAIVQGSLKVTYRELFILSEILLKKFSPAITAGDTVAIWCHLSIESIAALLAVVRAGGIYVPIHVDWPLQRIQKALITAKAQYFCVGEALLSSIDLGFLSLHSINRVSIPSFDQMLPDIEKEKNHAHQDENFSYVSDIDLKQARSIFYIIFTSGSTGDAKGALVYQDSFVNLLQWYIEALSLNAEDRALVFTSFAFDLTQKNIWATLATGATLYLPKLHYFVVDLCCDIIQQERITRINSSPSLFYALLEKTSLDCAQETSSSPLLSLQSVVLGGEAIQYRLLEQWHTTHTARLYNSYGPTECTDVVTYALISRPNLSTIPQGLSSRAQKESQLKTVNSQIPLGSPIFNTMISIRNPSNQVMRCRQVGEICISGLPLGGGYIARDDLTRQVFLSSEIEQCYKTGDFGYIAEDGLLYFTGRRDDQIKLRGLRIELSEIEQAILSFDRQCAVFCWQETLVAFVVEKTSFSIQKFRQSLLEKLPLYSIPEVFFILDQLPLTSSGKVDRVLLKNLYGNRLQEASLIPRLEHFSAEEIRLKNALVRIWGSILKKEVHEQQSFFQQGGHSLLALNLLYQIQSAWGVQLNLSDLLVYDSIATQTHWLSQKINQKKSGSNIYILKEFQNKPAYDWVVIHPILGDLACYAYWVKQFSGPAQVIGIACPDALERYSHATELLSDYADSMMQHLKTKRVRLLGYSFGAILVLALIPFLKKKEISIEWVGLIDSDLSTDFSDLLSQSSALLIEGLQGKSQELAANREAIEGFYQKAKEQGMISGDYPYRAFESRAFSIYHLYRLFSGVSLQALDAPCFMAVGRETYQKLIVQHSPFLAAPTLVLDAVHVDILNEMNSQSILDFIATL